MRPTGDTPARQMDDAEDNSLRQLRPGTTTDGVCWQRERYTVFMLIYIFFSKDSNLLLAMLQGGHVHRYPCASPSEHT